MRWRSFENGEIGKKFLFRISVSIPRLSVGQKPRLTKSNSHSQPHFKPKRDITKRTTPNDRAVWQSTRTRIHLHTVRSKVMGRPYVDRSTASGFSFDCVAEFGDRVRAGIFLLWLSLKKSQFNKHFPEPGLPGLIVMSISYGHVHNNVPAIWTYP